MTCCHKTSRAAAAKATRIARRKANAAVKAGKTIKPSRHTKPVKPRPTSFNAKKQPPCKTCGGHAT